MNVVCPVGLSRGNLKPDLLILDDMGMKQLPKNSGEFLFEVIMRPHELRSTMMTNNRPLEDLGKLIGDVLAATAILARFLQHATMIQISGRSYRLKGQATKANSETESTKSKPAQGLPGLAIRCNPRNNHLPLQYNIKPPGRF